MSTDELNLSPELEEALKHKPEKFEICRNCEYYDDGTGEKRTAKSGDCLNRYSLRFTPERDFTCKEFYPLTTGGR